MLSTCIYLCLYPVAYCKQLCSVKQFLHQTNLRLVDGRCVSVAHGADFESVVSFQVALTKELLHDAVCPLTVQVQRLRRVAQVGAVNQSL